MPNVSYIIIIMYTTLYIYIMFLFCRSIFFHFFYFYLFSRLHYFALFSFFLLFLQHWFWSGSKSAIGSRGREEKYETHTHTTHAHLLIATHHNDQKDVTPKLFSGLKFFCNWRQFFYLAYILCVRSGEKCCFFSSSSN